MRFRRQVILSFLTSSAVDVVLFLTVYPAGWIYFVVSAIIGIFWGFA